MTRYGGEADRSSHSTPKNACRAPRREFSLTDDPSGGDGAPGMKPDGGDAGQNHYAARFVGDADAATGLFCSHCHLGDHRPSVPEVADDDRSPRQDDPISLQNLEIMEIHVKIQCLVVHVARAARRSRRELQMAGCFEGGYVSVGTISMLRAYELASARFSEGDARYCRLRTRRAAQSRAIALVHGYATLSKSSSPRLLATPGSIARGIGAGRFSAAARRRLATSRRWVARSMNPGMVA